MDIEAIVKKYFDPYEAYWKEQEAAMRAALTELAAGYEERIRQMEAELAESQKNIKKAFYEGFSSYISPCGSQYDEDTMWNQSEARSAMLAAAPAKEGE